MFRRFPVLLALPLAWLLAGVAAAQSCADHICTECKWLCRKHWPNQRTSWKNPPKDPDQSVSRGAKEVEEGATWCGFVDAYGIQSAVNAWSYTGESRHYGPDPTRKSLRQEVKFSVSHVNTCKGCAVTSGRVEAIADTQFELIGSIAHDSDSISVAQADQWIQIRIPDPEGDRGPSTDQTEKTGLLIMDCRASGGYRLRAKGSAAWIDEGSFSFGVGPDHRGQWGPQGSIDMGGSSTKRYDLGTRESVKIGFAPEEPGCDLMIETNFFACFLGCEVLRHAVRLKDPVYASGESRIRTTRHQLELNLSCDDCGATCPPQTFVFDMRDREQEEEPWK